MRDSKLFIISIVIAILCYGLIKLKMEEERKEAIGVLEIVIVAETDIPPGTILDTSHIEPKEIPLKYYAPNSILGKDWRKIIGLKTTRDIKKGDQLSYDDIPTLSQRLADDIPLGKRSFTITVNSNSSQSGQIQPGDWVDVISIFLTDKEVSSKTLLQNIKVLAVGGQRIDSDRTQHYSEVSLLLTPTQCQTIALAQRLGDLTLALRSPKDNEPVSIPATREEDLEKETIQVPR